MSTPYRENWESIRRGYELSISRLIKEVYEQDKVIAGLQKRIGRPAWMRHHYYQLADAWFLTTFWPVTFLGIVALCMWAAGVW